MNRRMNLFSLAFPIWVENVLNRLLGFVNVLLLAKLSEDAVAAIGVANQFINFITMAFTFITFGAAVLIAQHMGAKDEKGANEVASVAMVTNVLFGLFMGLMLLLFHKPLLRTMNMEGILLDYSSTYLLIIGGFCCVNAFNQTLATILRNLGKPQLPMMVFLMMNVVNIAGNACVILRPFHLPEFGIGGVATVTILSQTLALIVMTIAAIKVGFKLRLPKPFSFRVLGSILKIGFPGAGDSIAFNIANIVLTYFVTSMGSTALVAQTYASQFVAVLQTPGYAVGQATQIMVGYKCGAHDFDGAYRMANRNLWIAMGLNLILTTFILIFRRQLCGLYNASEEVFALVSAYLWVDLILEFGRPFNLVYGVSVRGTGDVMWSMITAYISVIGVCIPLGYMLTQVFHLPLYAVGIALCADEWLRGQFMHFRWRSRKWEKYVVIKEEQSAA